MIWDWDGILTCQGGTNLLKFSVGLLESLLYLFEFRVTLLVRIPKLGLLSRDCQILHYLGPSCDVLHNVIISQLPRSCYTVNKMLDPSLLVPIPGTNQEPEDVGVELGNGSPHPLSRIHDGGQLSLRESITNLRQGLCETGDNLLVIDSCL